MAVPRNKSFENRPFSTDKLINIFEESVCVLDNNFRLILCNDSYKNHINTQPEKSFINTIHLEDRDAFLKEVPTKIKEIDEIKLRMENISGGYNQYVWKIRNEEDFFFLSGIESDKGPIGSELESIINTTPACVKLLDNTGVLLSMNSKGLNMIEADSAESVIGHNVYELVAPEHRQEFIRFNERVCGGEKLSFQFVIIGLKGTRRWMETHATPLKYHDNSTVQLAVTNDITARKNDEADLKSLLEITKEQNKKLRNFAHIVSHNIRSHSSNIMSLLGFIEDEVSEAEKHKLFEMLKTSMHKLEDTIQNLNQITAISTKKNQSWKKVSLLKEVENAIKTLSGTIKKQQIDLKIVIAKELKIWVIPAYLDSILLNLISNAIKYRSKNRKTEIHLNATKLNGFIELKVRDNGMGIDLKKYGKKLFGMYNTFHQNEDATGFGLFITKTQVEEMEGTISVESEVDKGSIFSVKFKN